MLTIDFNTEVAPDFGTKEHRFTREAVRHNRNKMSNAQAAKSLFNLQSTEHNQRKAVCKAKQKEREVENRPWENSNRSYLSRLTADDNMLQSRPSKQQSPESGKKASNLVCKMPVHNVIEYLLTCFAIKKLRECKYIKLSYFLPEGCAEAARNKAVSAGKVFIAKKKRMCLQ